MVVELVKKHVNATTLAIGDGANDVSMIRGNCVDIYVSLLINLQYNFFLECKELWLLLPWFYTNLMLF